MSIKIAVGGQMDKQTIESLINGLNNDQVEVSVLSDLDAALGVQSGTYDYYIGACATGAGAAIAMAMAMLGGQNCVSLSIPGNVKSESEIIAEVQSGKKAFGFVNTDAPRIIPTLVTALINK